LILCENCLVEKGTPLLASSFRLHAHDFLCASLPPGNKGNRGREISAQLVGKILVNSLENEKKKDCPWRQSGKIVINSQFFFQGNLGQTLWQGGEKKKGGGRNGWCWECLVFGEKKGQKKGGVRERRHEGGNQYIIYKPPGGHWGFWRNKEKGKQCASKVFSCERGESIKVKANRANGQRGDGQMWGTKYNRNRSLKKNRKKGTKAIAPASKKGNRH